MSHQSTELLPCPFCGGNAELKYSQGSEVWPQKWWCECLNCKLSYGGKFGSNFYERKSTGTKNQDDKARDAAISLWNHRILLDAPAEMQIHDERAEFEKWYHEDHGSSDYRCRSSGAYCNWEVQVAWQTWQARAELAIASGKREPQWMPIEGAPKGRKLIAGYFNKLGNWRTIIARYYLPGTLAASDDADESQCDEEGYAKEGWYEESETHEFIMPTDEPPTYYMLLTPPPVKDSLTTDSGESK